MERLQHQHSYTYIPVLGRRKQQRRYSSCNSSSSGSREGGRHKYGEVELQHVVASIAMSRTAQADGVRVCGLQ